MSDKDNLNTWPERICLTTYDSEIQNFRDEEVNRSAQWVSRKYYGGDIEYIRADIANQEIVALHSKLAGEKLRADQGWERYEAANRRALASDAQVEALTRQLEKAGVKP